MTGREVLALIAETARIALGSKGRGWALKRNDALGPIEALLASGVVVHVHDIHWPFTYPKRWLEEGRRGGCRDR